MSAAPLWLWALHCLAAFVVLAEALNKLERTSPLSRYLAPRARLTETVKAIAWGLLALGAGGTLLSPLFMARPPNAEGSCLAIGIALLIVKTRVKEG